MPSKLDQSEYIRRVELVHHGAYSYSSLIYKNALTKVEVICPRHGKFSQLPFNHLKGVGCPACGAAARANNISLNTVEFISKATSVHQGRYDYSRVNYTGYNNKVKIVCPEHGEFEQRANNHLAGIGCPAHGRESARSNQLKSYTPSRRGKLRSTHSAPLVNNQRVFQCQCGRQTVQSGYSVENGLVKTCGSCLALSRDYWLSKTWGYLVLNKSQTLPDEWPAFTHSQFQFDCRCGQSTQVRMADIVDGHTLSCGCLIPGKSEHSPAKKIEEYVAGLDCSFSSDDRSIIPPFELDIWMPDFQLAIEFNGKYYHSLDGTESPLTKYRHRDKFNLCQQNGILLLQVDEHEWSNPITREVWKSVIASKLGKHYRVLARKTRFQPISSAEANAFLAINHLQGVTPALRWSFGLFHQNELVGVVSYCYHQHTQINLSRLAFKLNTTVVGGAQKLFKNSLPLLPAGNIVSFSNNQYSNGAIYTQLGFVKAEDLQPSYQWYFKGRVWNKRSLRKGQLAKLLPDFNSIETEHQNLYRNGARCLYDAGYQKWLFYRDNQTIGLLDEAACNVNQPPSQ